MQGCLPQLPTHFKHKENTSHHGTTMTEGLMTPLRSVLTCPGCTDRYNDTDKRPKFLSCFHTACLACLSKRCVKGKVQCPACGHITESASASALADNTQICTIILNMSSLNLYESPAPVRDHCPTHAARINFWCETCRMPLCRDCTVLAHRQSAGHRVRDHDEAMATLKAEVRQALSDSKTLQLETRRLRQDHRKYLVRQLDACRAFEKQLKSDLKAIDNDKKEENKLLEKIEQDLCDATSLLTLQQTVDKANELRVVSAQEFATAKAIVTEKLLTLGKLNRSMDDLDMSMDGESRSLGSGSPSSPSHGLEKRSKTLASRLLHNGKGKLLRPTFSLEAPPSYILPSPKVYLDFSIEGIVQTCRVVCELRPDKAPKLTENFIRLCTGRSGYGFKGSKIFRCLPGWWIQGGDFECNNGEGGKSAMDAEFIQAETTDLEPRPGALEMLCVSTNKEGTLMVGSQFFIHVKKYSYTHVFGYVLDGLDLIDSLSKFGNSKEVYRPNKIISIVDCGLLKI